MRGLKELFKSSPTLFMSDIGGKNLHIVMAYFFVLSHALASD